MSDSSSTATTANGAAVFVGELERLGVDLAFGLPGVHNLPIWRAIAESDIRLVGVRHEQTAVYAADGYARATGKLGVALVTSGPGAANAVGATGEAMASRSPVLVVATEVARKLRKEGVNRGVLHEVSDQAALFAPVTKSAVSVLGADELAATVSASARTALAPSPGPVYVGIPTDALAQDTEAIESSASEPARAALGEDELAAAAAIIEAAERPLIWSGGGAVHAEAGPLVVELAERLGAPVLTTYAGRGIVPPEHPCAAPGTVHSPPVGRLWDEADVVIAIGTDFDGMMTQNWAMPAPRRLIAVNVDAIDAAKNYEPDVTLVGDAREVLEDLLPRLGQGSGTDALGERLAAIDAEIAADVREDSPEAAEFLGAMADLLPAEAIAVADMCIPGYWMAGHWAAPAPRKLAYPVGWGTLGFGFPASIGAALAGAGPAVCVVGDGGFLFGCGELATLAQERVPLTVVLVDDGGYGMLRFDQVDAGEEAFGVDLARPDFEALARSFGVDATSVDGFGEDFRAQLERDLGREEPTVLVVRAGYAGLKPPRSTSPRWYRKKSAGEPDPTPIEETRNV